MAKPPKLKSEKSPHPASLNQQKTTLDSNISEVEQDVLALIKKHYPNLSNNQIDIFGEDGDLGKTGFYLVFIKRDEDNLKGRLAVHTFGSHMNMGDIVEAFSAKVADTINNQKKIPIA